VAIFSYNGSIFFGLLADRDTVDDLEAIAGHIEASVQELREAAQIASSANGDGMAGDNRPRLEGEREGLLGA
jgi:hypothetical protein